MRIRNAVLLATLVVVGAANSVHAETKTKPQVSISTKAVEVTLTVDPALRKFPRLFESSLAEGRRWAERNRAEAAKAMRDEPEFFRSGRRWTFERSYTLRSVVGRYVSVVRHDGTNTGGAHPNSYVDTILWDRNTRRRVSVRPFFRETADNGPTMTALAQLARVAVAAEKLKRGAINVDVPKDKLTPESLAEQDRFIADGVPPSLGKIGPITLAPSTEAGKSAGLTFHYSPYAVGPYAEGPYTVFVPWTAFQKYLSPRGLAIFGGQRPESDSVP
ncbi:MAG: DUF3298 domain-containing protein [Rhizobiales bacterium]|nr:DUF3298 domain-containing protein [Hyphomicrobiales bacterium]